MTNNIKINMRRRCRHDIKIEVLMKLFKPMTRRSVKGKTKLKSRKINKILGDFKEKN